MGLTNENIAKLIWQYVYPDLLTKAKKRYTEMDRIPIIKNPELFEPGYCKYSKGLDGRVADGLIYPLDVLNGWLSPYKENDITRPIFTSAAMNIC